MGQTIISAGLIVLVTIAVINANRLVINSQITKLEAQARLEASDIAMEIITEARTKKFDALVDGTDWQDVSEFGAPASLGRGSHELIALPDVSPYQSIGGYDDFDDYKNYSRTVSTKSMTGYQVSCRVFYVTRTSPDVPYTSGQTYLKTLQVFVSHPLYLRDTLRISMTKTH